MGKKWKVVIKEKFNNCEYIYPIQQRKVKELIEYLKKDDNVELIVIFGSSVTDNCHVGSDIDIYIKLKENKKVIKDKYFDFSYDLWTNYTVDARLYKEILKKGVVVYER